jgi:hypothetical protein
VSAAFVFSAPASAAQSPDAAGSKAPVHAKQVKRLLMTGAMVLPGPAVPAYSRRIQDRLGRVRQGYIADLLVINGNPLANLRIMNPYGTDLMAYDGKIIDNYSPMVQPGDPHVTLVHGGGIEWTIKDGIPYHAPNSARAAPQGRRTPPLVLKCVADGGNVQPTLRFFM